MKAQILLSLSVLCIYTFVNAQPTDKPDLRPTVVDKPVQSKHASDQGGSWDAPIPGLKNGTPQNDNGGGTTGGGNTGGGVVTIRPVQDEWAQNVKDCKAAFKNAFPGEDQKKYEMPCENSDVRRAITDRNKNNGVSKSNYLMCLGVIKSLNYDDGSSITECAFEYRNSVFIKKEFAQCFAAISPDFTQRAAYRDCQDSTFSHEYKTQDFKDCRAKMKELGQNADTTLDRCKNFAGRSRIISRSFSKCQAMVQPVGVTNGQILNFCSQDSVINSMSQYDFPACQSIIGQVTKDPLIAISMCTNFDVLMDIKSAPKCYLASLASTHNYYVANVALNSNTNNGDKNYFSFLSRDCKSARPQNLNAQNPYLQFVRDINIHTFDRMTYPDKDKPKATVQVGGMSSLAYNEKTEMLYMLSDETYLSTQLPPRMYTYKLNGKFELIDQTVVPFTFGKNQAPDIDPEGLVLLKSGHFIVSSEIGKNNAEVAKDKILSLTNLNIFDEKANYVSSIALPESFKTQVEEYFTEYWEESGGFLGIGSKKEKKKTKHTRVIGGLEFNKSLEALAISPDESTLFIANESALMQDMNLNGKCPKSKGNRHHDQNGNRQNNDRDQDGQNDKDGNNDKDRDVAGQDSKDGNKDGKSGKSGKKDKGQNQNGQQYSPYGQYNYNPCGKVIRIARFAKTNKGYQAADEFKYELEPEVDNGLVEMISLDPSTVLTLERSYDNNKQKVVSRIFKVKLSTDATIPAKATNSQINAIEAVEKILVLDLDAILPSLSPGFRILDNFEGMTFGPVLPNGNRTLLLVSDNNFSARQRTALLVFEVLPELLK